ncbi:MAG: hypothetical protein ABJA32_06625 [Ginsengibacter sp.]
MKKTFNSILIKISLILCSTILLIAMAFKSDAHGIIQSLDLATIASRNTNTKLVSTSSFFEKPVLKIIPDKNNAGVVIWKKGDKNEWSVGKYFVFEVYGDNEYSGIINIEFFKENGTSGTQKLVLQSGEESRKIGDVPWLSSLMGILPRLKTQVVFPLSYLDAQQIFIPRSPRQLKGTINGNRLDPNDIVKVILRFGPNDAALAAPKFELASVFVTKDPPKPYPPLSKPIIDEFGQWKLKNWPGKIADEKDLIEKNLKVEKMAQAAKFPNDWSKYGGWKEKIFKKTGFFRTQNDGKRWWLVDPDGYAFLSVGVDVIGYGSSGPVNGIEDLFEWLPGNKSKNDQVDFYKSNLTRVYGQNARSKWSAITKGLMKEYRLNTIGNWSDPDFIKESNLPYALPLSDFPSTTVALYRDFPDVFSDEYKQNAVRFAAQLESRKDDPYMIGYFLRNEPQWAFGYHNIAYEMFGTNQKSDTKTKFIEWIEKKYDGKTDAFNDAWKLNIKNFSDLDTITFKSYPSDTADKDFYRFSEIMVSKYVDVPSDEVDKVDSNHLNLGMRYAWLSSDLLYKAGERFDVFSINGYGIDPPPTAEISKKSGKPVMIGEFHQGSIDRGLPATGIIGVLNQNERAKAYRNYIEQGFARPELIGMHYFQWIDQPFYGRFDGENYNIGIVDQSNVPYPELTRAMTITNERIYKVGSGLIQPVKEDVKKITPIHY